MVSIDKFYDEYKEAFLAHHASAGDDFRVDVSEEKNNEGERVIVISVNDGAIKINGSLETLYVEAEMIAKYEDQPYEAFIDDNINHVYKRITALCNKYSSYMKCAEEYYDVFGNSNSTGAFNFPVCDFSGTFWMVLPTFLPTPDAAMDNKYKDELSAVVEDCLRGEYVFSPTYYSGVTRKHEDISEFDKVRKYL